MEGGSKVRLDDDNAEVNELMAKFAQIPERRVVSEIHKDLRDFHEMIQAMKENTERGLR